MRFNISVQSYHEIASLFPNSLPRAHEIQNLKKSLEIIPVNSTDCSVEGAECDFVKLLSETIRKLLNKDPTRFTTNKVKVKISLDGAKYSRTSNFCILSFTVLCGGREFNQSNVQVVSVIKAEETYENIAEGMRISLQQINALIAKPNIVIYDEVYDLEFFLCSDYKMILMLMGLKQASCKYACVWCKVEDSNRWDTDVNDSMYLVKKRRTLKSLYNDYEKKQYCCKRLPLLQIELDHVIPDELHLLLRITDVLLRNLISTAVAHDKCEMRSKWKLNKGPMINSILKNIRRCGIPFNIWNNNEENKSAFTFTSLPGYRKKNLLKFFPSRIPLCQPQSTPDQPGADKVKKLWEDFKDTYDIISSKNPLIDYNRLHEKAKKWVDDFTKLRSLNAGYRPKYITPYMHVMMYHAPHFIRMYGNLKQFTCQAIEKKNDVCKSIYFKSSNKLNPTVDIVKHELRIKKVMEYARRKRSYAQRSTEQKNGSKMSQSRAKRRRTE
ncbi:uncharacterized protein [Dysidea avara]|uniref:uncharacterized protein n=1 Tax=Dysidea avara TaxID=196820 RepID=UPI003330317A